MKIVLILGLFIWGIKVESVKVNYVHNRRRYELSYLVMPEKKEEKKEVKKVIKEKVKEEVKKVKEEKEGKEENLSDTQKVFVLTNEIRKKAGVKVLMWDNTLAHLAQVRSEEIAASAYFEHQRPNGQRVESILSENGYTYKYFGENIARDYFSVPEVVLAWQNSLGHYHNMINKNFQRIGVGMARKGKKIYWVQFFT